ncbi:MAG: hypothetical protein GKR87_13715 [Kiritimatiellae bacterium]|nr:hypothetical protein [Kiritimatiellia bacterium]
MNGKRRENITVIAGEELNISTKIKYKKRAKADITTVYMNNPAYPSINCSNSVERAKRIKPAVTISSTVTVSNAQTLVSTAFGTGEVTTIVAPTTDGMYTLVATFTAQEAGNDQCIEGGIISTTKIFTLTVQEGVLADIVAVRAEDTNVIVNSGTYLSRNQAQELMLTANLTSPLDTLSFDEDQIIWQLSPPEAGTFVSSGTDGDVGKVVHWKQATDYVSKEVDDVVITLSVPDSPSKEFKLTIFNINTWIRQLNAVFCTNHLSQKELQKSLDAPSGCACVFLQPFASKAFAQKSHV